MKYLLSCSHSDFDSASHNIETVAETCLYAGASGIEGYHTFFRGMDEKALSETAELFRESSLAIPSFHLPCSKIPDYDLSGQDSVKRKNAAAVYCEWIGKAAALGAFRCVAHTTTTDIILSPEREDSILDAFSSSLEVILEEAQKNRVRIALENHNPSVPDRFGSRAEHFVKIRKRFDSSELGFCFDFGHAFLEYGNRYEEIFEVLRDRIITFHIHDNSGAEDQHLPPGYGGIDWKRAKTLISSIPEAGICIESAPHPSLASFLRSDWKKMVMETKELLE